MARKYELMINEIRLIKDLSIQKMVMDTLEKAPEYFWTIPSSSTGKHHPPDEFKEGGKVLHTRRATKIADTLCESFDVDSYHHDIIIAATILHDICSNGYPGNNGCVVTGHGYLAGQVMRDAEVLKDINVMPTTIKEILDAASVHMGRWDVPFTPPHELAGLIVHLADYFVSRRCVNVDLEVNECPD